MVASSHLSDCLRDFFSVFLILKRKNFAHHFFFTLQMFQNIERSPHKSPDSSLSEFLWSTKMRMMANQVCKEVLPTLSRLSGLPKSRIRVGISECYSYLTSFILDGSAAILFGLKLFTRHLVLPPCFSRKKNRKSPTKNVFHLNGKSPLAISGYYSAQCKFLSIIGVSPAVIGEIPDEFNCNNVVVGGKRYTKPQAHKIYENLIVRKNVDLELDES